VRVDEPPTETTEAPTETQSPSPTATPEPGPTNYAGFLDSDEVAAIQQQVAAGTDPWQTGYAAQLRDARRALETDPLSVVDNGAPGDVDSHRFATGTKRADYRAAMKMGTWIRDLGLGYVFSGEERFAQHAIDLLHHWFVAPETRMYPSGQNFGETYFSIELHITIPTMLYGAALVGDSRRWSEAEGTRTGLRTWVETYLADLEDGRGDDKYTGVVRNNIYSWWLVARATAAAYLEDSAALDRVFEDWRDSALDQVEPNGLLKHERQRSDGLAYSVYGLKALALTAEIARHFDVDLWGYRLDDDETSTLLRAFQGHQQYVVDQGNWTWGVGENGYTEAEREASGSVYELAHSQWGRPGFKAVVESVGRPLYERRVLGWTTLTHANRFALDVD
jgi:hypothetical protein